MQKVIIATIISLTFSMIGLKPAQANNPIQQCLNNDKRAKNKILATYKDSGAWKDPNPNRPVTVFQIGQEMDWGVSVGNRKGYGTRVVVLFKSGQCKWQSIIGYYGYEPFVPFNVAVEMEIKDIDWKSQNIISNDIGDPPDEDIDVAAEIGHGCEPWTQAMAQARKRKGLSLDGCPVRKQRLKPFWQTQ